MRMQIKEIIERDKSIQFKTKHGSVYLSKTDWAAIFHTITFAFPHKKKDFCSDGIDTKDLIDCYLYAHKKEYAIPNGKMHTFLLPGN